MGSLFSNFITAIPIKNFLNHCSKQCPTAGLLSDTKDQPGHYNGHLSAAQRALPATFLTTCPVSPSRQNSQHWHIRISLLAGWKRLGCFQYMTEDLLHTSIKIQFVHSMEDRHTANTVHKIKQQRRTTHVQYFVGPKQAAYLTQRKRFPQVTYSNDQMETHREISAYFCL